MTNNSEFNKTSAPYIIQDELDKMINHLKECGSSRELSLTVTKLEEAKMWHEKALEAEERKANGTN